MAVDGRAPRQPRDLEPCLDAIHTNTILEIRAACRAVYYRDRRLNFTTFATRASTTSSNFRGLTDIYSHDFYMCRVNICLKVIYLWALTRCAYARIKIMRVDKLPRL